MSDTHNPHDHESIGELPTAPTPSKGKLFSFAGGVLALFAVVFFAGYLPRVHERSKLEAETAELSGQKPVVQVAKPKVQPPSGELSLPGTVQPLMETVIYPRTSGYLKRWLVDIGDTVQQGQLLAEIDTPEVDDQLRAAEATMGELKAALEQAKTQLELARVNLKRVQDLATTGFSSQQERDERTATFHVAEANVKAAEAKIATQQAEVSRLAQLKSFARVTAPFPGTITYRSTEIGSLVTSGNGAGQALFRLAKTDVVRVFINVPQVSAPSVQVGQTADVFVREFQGRPFKAKITRTAKALDPASHMLLTELQIPNKEGQLFAGMFAQAKLKVERSSPQLVVPSNALIMGEAGPHLATIDGNERVHLVSVQLGEDYGTEVGIVTGLNGDERVMLNPGDKAIEGLQVAVQTAPPAPKPGPMKASN